MLCSAGLSGPLVKGPGQESCDEDGTQKNSPVPHGRYGNDSGCIEPEYAELCPITATTFKMLHSIAEEEDVASLSFVIIVSQVWTSV